MAEDRAGSREWLGLAVLALPALLLAIDLSVLNVALPRLSEDLGASSTEQLWISDVYGFLVAGFLITMGRLGDRVGRRRLLMIGAFAFAAASVWAAFAGSVGTLIAARALLGVAGATLAPSTLALISTMFREPRQRGIGVAVYVSCFMGGAALGPVVGGVLLDRFWWGSVFLLGVPVMVLLLVAAPLVLPEYRDPAGPGLDTVSIVLSLGAVLAMVLGIKELAREGLGAVAAVAVVVGLALGLLFVRRQRRIETPLLDLDLFRRPGFGVVLVVLMVAVATQGGVMLLVTLHLQAVQGLSPLRAGMWGIPPALGMVAGSLLAPLLTRRLRPDPVIAAGLALAAAGYVTLTRAPVDGLLLLVAGGTVVFFGVGLVGALANDQIVGAVPPERAGSAAAVVQTGGDLGISLGIAVLGSVGTSWYAHRLNPGDAPADTTGAARASITDAVAQPELADAARTAFTEGLHVASWAGAALLAALCLLTVVTHRRHLPRDETTTATRTG